jgi:hypothetical protein
MKSWRRQPRSAWYTSVSALTKTRLFFLLLFAALVLARICHTGILWAEETLPLAAAEQMLGGKALYRDIWFDKPPLLAVFYLLWGARAGWLLRLAGSLYAWAACWIAYRFARDLWSETEGFWAAGLLGFFLVFDLPSSVIPLASDLLMLAPHMAAVWLAYRNRPFASGAAAGLAFLVSPKGLLVAAVCALWNPAGVIPMAAGFVTVGGVAGAWLWAGAALGAYWEEVWRWGRIYAAGTFVAEPLRNGAVRTLDWIGFHAALVMAAEPFVRSWRTAKDAIALESELTWSRSLSKNEQNRPTRAAPTRAGTVRERTVARTVRRAEVGIAPPRPWMRWIGWALISFAGVAAGSRFFPRYYFELLPVFILAAARGMVLWRPRLQWGVLVFLAIPLIRFGPQYARLADDLSRGRETQWSDTAMDRDSRAAAALTRQLADSGDTLFVWGFRPELYVYTRLPAATPFLDSQPLTGVPADRHLTQSAPVETQGARERRAQLAQSRPTFVLDGLGLYNPQLAITNYPDLRVWLENYREVARSGQTIIYRLRPARIGTPPGLR